MQLFFKSWCIITEDHRVDIELKRHACITQLTHPIQRFSALLHTQQADSTRPPWSFVQAKLP